MPTRQPDPQVRISAILGPLLRPRVLSFKNRILKSGQMRLLVFGLIGAALWGGVFAGAFRVLTYFQSIEQLGDILAYKLLSMIFIVMLSLLIFSSIITVLSKLYLSRDLDLVHSLPVAGRHVFLARWIESTADSSWMVVVFVLPVFIAYGIVFSAGPVFYFSFTISLVSLCITASALSAIAIAIAVNLISASRLKTIFVFMGLLLFVVLYMAFRLLRPERLVDPEMFTTTLVYLKSLSTPSTPWLPSTWAYDAVRASLSGSFGDTGFNLLLSVSFAAAMVMLMMITAHAVYFAGFSKSISGRTDSMKANSRRWIWYSLFFVPRRSRTFIEKEMKTFVRDQTQWSQVFLIAALIFIYVYNFKVLPFEQSPIKTVYLQNLFAFLNMGLAAFVLTAITARFAFPAVSMEKGAFWIVQSGPVSKGGFLRVKFFVYLFPLFGLTLLLIVLTNIFLQVSNFMMVLSVVTIVFMVPAIVAMGVGLGAKFPDFASENPAQAVTSFGGFVFMTTSVLYVLAMIMLEAGPTYRIFITGIRGHSLGTGSWIWIILSFGGAGALSIFSTMYALRLGEKSLMAK
ncbi:MAG: hypothetical protein SWH61_07490 [Thermodesulfobacteriota bacterium]|nr:hypothetical protein [Thermodesulfobacteriota bacterium]